MPADHPITVFGDPRLSNNFWDKVQPISDGCWIWTARAEVRGYGVINVKGDNGWRTILAHRLTYLALVGPITAETLDHLCRNRSCSNPAHLEQVSQKENCLRGEGLTAINARKTICKRGHPLVGRNVMWRKKPSVMRQCRKCKNDLRRKAPLLLSSSQPIGE